jgi:peptidyl-prolyl cis-trans isomerase SurA
MLHSLIGWCPSLKTFRSHRLSFLLAPALTAFCGLGCASQEPHLVAKGQTRQDRETELNTGMLFPAQFTGDKHAQATAGDSTREAAGVVVGDHPTVSRLQKPDSEPAKRDNRGSLLDLVSHETVVPGNAETSVRIRATVNGVAILDDEVREAVYPLLVEASKLPTADRAAKQREILEGELRHLIEREVVLQDAFAKLKERPVVLEKFKEAAGKEFDKKIRDMRSRYKIKTDEEFKAWLQMQGVTVDGVRRKMEREFMAQEYMRSRVADALERVSHQQIEEYYKQHPEEFQIQDSVVWNDIFIDAAKFPNRDAARQLAESIIAKARAGEDFLKLVNQFDNGDSSYRNGEGYGHRRGEIKPPEAEAILFKMEQSGEIGPLIELAYGFHVIRLVQREYAGLRPFDAKTQLAVLNKLKYEAFERESKKVLAELKRKATIEVSSSTP